ncbi:MAG: hypothetical protein WBA97_19090 [Actinophytocola sp.]|uniref:hypothetical protein n=1 Tax=Actinophytocola sp. TaxID=1872138 RepID=UPI003C75B3DC
MVSVAGTAARAAGLYRGDWITQDGGDSEFAVLPSMEPEVVVVDRYVRELTAELHRYNDRLRPEARLRLRVAMHFGPLSPAELGHAGPAPVAVARLLDSGVLRAALAEVVPANLALLLSERIYTDTVASLATTWRPDEFRQVRVHQKEFDEPAWLCVPGHDVHAMTLRVDEPPREPGPTSPGAQHVVQNTINTVHGERVVFGMQFGADQ